MIIQMTFEPTQADNFKIPVIDIFAGPGGLGEGFSSVECGETGVSFRIALSIEKEFFSHQTLKLRAFYREFPKEFIPEEYYQYLKGEISQEVLFGEYPTQFNAAEKTAWCAELGIVDPDEVDRRISIAINGSKNWVLIGGPPCQAYSIAGRSRKSKIWRDNPLEKENDEKNFLYREYLRILS